MSSNRSIGKVFLSCLKTEILKLNTKNICLN